MPRQNEYPTRMENDGYVKKEGMEGGRERAEAFTLRPRMKIVLLGRPYEDRAKKPVLYSR